MAFETTMFTKYDDGLMLCQVFSALQALEDRYRV